jgi:hypothetical protein
MSKKLLIEIDEELWEAILAEAGGDDGIEAFFEDWNERVRIIKSEEQITEGNCDGCGGPVTLEFPGKECHLQPKVYHINHCWEEHLGECIEED